MGTLSAGFVGMRVRRPGIFLLQQTLTRARIVEYATKDQAQQAVNTLSNQNLMGRLVYVREVFGPTRLVEHSLQKNTSLTADFYNSSGS